MATESDAVPQIAAHSEFDTSNAADCMANLGRHCDHCGEPWTREVTPTYGGRWRSLGVKVTATCPDCGASEYLTTSVEQTVRFDVEEREVVEA